MTSIEENLRQELADLAKNRDLLQYSLEKCRRISFTEGMSNEELESFEALTSRFARMSDIIIQKVLRLFDVLDLEDMGTVRDRINRAEKKGIIKSADEFIDIRILRNEVAHEYKSDTINKIFARVLDLAPILITSLDTITAYAQRYEKKA